MANKIVFVALVCTLVAFVQCAPQFQQARQLQPQPQPIQPQPISRGAQRQAKFRVVSENFHQEPNLEYAFDQKFESGETFAEEGKLKTVEREGKSMDVIVTRGSYTIVNDDGSTVVVNYTADENGFHPEIITEGPARG